VLNYFDRLTESLARKLVVIIGLLILSGSGIFWYASIRADRRDLMDNSVAFISSFSEMIDRSIRYDMLLNHKEHIQRALESIGATAAIKRVNLFSKNGEIRFSSEKGMIGRRVIETSPPCVGCHNDRSRPRETLLTGKQWTIYDESEGRRVLSFVEPIYNEPDCFTALCHAHSQEQRVLGILTTDFSLSAIDKRIKEKMINTSLFTLLFLAASAAILYLIFWRFVLKPITVLSKGMERVTSGDLSQMVPYPSKDEIGKLALTFNLMTTELRTSRQKMEAWTHILAEEVEKKTLIIKKAQDKLIEVEKLAALGRLTADIAHEIRNPLSALGGFGRRLQKIVAGKKEKEYSDIIVAEVNRLEHILRDILSFSREAKFHFERMPVTAAVKDSIATFSELCTEHSIEVVVELNTDFPVLMDKMHTRQAIDNLLSNAIDAMPEGGTLAISTTVEKENNIDYVIVQVLDTGAGIPEDKLSLIFEPFHTTKVIGHGTGLGLSITRKIVEEHGGFIKAVNNIISGITFRLYFPYQSNEDLLGTPCWEFMKCNRDVNCEVKCPAYPNFGRACWVVAGTFCAGKVQGTFAQKYEDCSKCDFYEKVLQKKI
jgi:two-component system, NtrC family, sensor kinase